jgi:methyl-accepting chemotaxis protein
VNEIATTIAAAVEQQGAATQEISRNVQQAAGGTTEVASNIGNVSQAAQDTGAAATQVLSSAGELARNGTLLKDQVESFLREVRA